MPPRSRLLLGAAAVGVGAWPLVEPLFPVLRHVRVPVLPPGAGPVRVLHVSDLHLLARHRRRAAWVASLADQGADLVVSTGDHWSSADALDRLVQALGALTADGTPGVHVPGNNDPYSPVLPHPAGYLRPRRRPRVRRPPDLPWERAVARLADVGWTDLCQRRTTLTLAGRPVTLTGTADAHLRQDRYAEVAGAVTGLGLGITHTPARRLLRAFAADGHALVLAGHTHGGQLRLPGVGPLVTNCDLPRARARGLTSDAGGWLHVSAGLGTSPYLPLRFCCRPEATLLELVPGGAGDGVR